GRRDERPRPHASSRKELNRFVRFNSPRKPGSGMGVSTSGVVQKLNPPRCVFESLNHFCRMVTARNPRRVQCSARKEDLMLKTVFAATAALVITAIPVQAQTCTRDGLKAIVANYFKAVETHNMSALETAPNLRITQNGSEIKPGEGFFKTGGKSQFQRTLIDTERCGTVTQAIIDETPDPNAPAPAGRGGARGAAGPRGAAPGGGAGGGAAPGAGPAGPRQGGAGGAPAGARGGLPAAAPYTGPAVILAVRLKVDKGKVSEIETIV